ncbi:MAG: hypothetical protein H7269_11375 [Cellulomonas sp.]|nr:hypothetical protein [Cellulomonas sp.]
MTTGSGGRGAHLGPTDDACRDGDPHRGSAPGDALDLELSPQEIALVLVAIGVVTTIPPVFVMFAPAE